MSIEYPFIVDSLKGLRPDNKDRDASSGFLVTCTNIRVVNNGLEQQEAIANTISGVTVTQSWPWPQILEEEEIILLFFSTTIWSLNRDTWVATQITTYDSLIPANTKAIPSGGGVWHLAAFGEHWIATKGNCHVFLFPGQSSKAYVVDSTTDTTVFQSCCNHDGRLIVGGISGTYLADSVFLSLFRVWRSSASKNIKVSDEAAIQGNWLLFGAKGGSDIDLPFWPLMHILSYPSLTAVTKARELLYNLIEKGEVQFLQLPANGTVQCLRPFQNGFVAYTTDRVIIMREEGNTYVPQVISKIGIPSRGCVSGSSSKHLYVNKSLQLNQIDSGGHRNLRYADQLTGLTTSLISMVWNEGEDETYISDGTSGYIYTDFGLSKTITFTSAIMESNIGVQNSPASPQAFDIKTGETNLGTNGLKYVNYVLVKTYNCTSMKLNLEYRMSPTASWIQTADIYGSGEGEFYVGVACNEFRIRLRGTVGTAGKIEELSARCQFQDRQIIRGPRGTGVGQVQSGADV